jgi:hypothetical protein
MTASNTTPTHSAQQLIDTLALHKRVLAMQLEGLSHGDSLRQAPFRGNCLNWVLGHIAVNRNHILTLLGEESILDDETIARYDTGSEPVLADGDGVLTFEELRGLIEQEHVQIEAALSVATADVFEQVTPASDPKSVLDAIRFRIWHETYHVGQTEYLRQIAGTNDHVI